MRSILRLLGFKKYVIFYTTSIPSQELINLRREFYKADMIDFVFSDKNDVKVFYSLC